MQKFKLLLDFISLDVVAFFIKENLHRAIGAFILLVGLIFAITYFLNERNSNKERLLGEYVMSINYFSQNDLVLAARHSQNVYNNANGMIEMASLMQVVDVLFEDKQNEKIFDIISEAADAKHSHDNSFLFYSYLFQTIQKLEANGMAQSKALPLVSKIQRLLEKAKVSSNYSAYKIALLTEMNAITKIYNLNHYTKNISTDASAGEFGKILNSI